MKMHKIWQINYVKLTKNIANARNIKKIARYELHKMVQVVYLYHHIDCENFKEVNYNEKENFKCTFMRSNGTLNAHSMWRRPD